VIGTELGGAGSLSKATMEVARIWLRRALSHVGSYRTSVPVTPPRKTRLTRTRWRGLIVYASDSGVYEPLGEQGDEVEPNQGLARASTSLRSPAGEPILA